MNGLNQNGLDNNGESTQFENQGNLETPVVEFEEGGEGEAETTEAGEAVEGTSEAEAPSAEPPTTEGEQIPVSEGIDDETSGTKKTEFAEEGEGLSSIIENSCKEDEEDKDKKFAKEEDKEEKSDSEKNEDNTEEKEEKEDDEEKKKFSLEQELSELRTQFAALQEENEKLLAFKQEVENKEKDELIASFYMLSDEDKKDVIANKANYSLKEIKAELSMICVDKKVNFSLENTSNDKEVATTYNLNSHQADTLPAWLRAVEDTRNRNK